MERLLTKMGCQYVFPGMDGRPTEIELFLETMAARYGASKGALNYLEVYDAVAASVLTGGKRRWTTASLTGTLAGGQTTSRRGRHRIFS